jgi:hypothetical protein
VVDAIGQIESKRQNPAGGQPALETATAKTP